MQDSRKPESVEKYLVKPESIENGAAQESSCSDADDHQCEGEFYLFARYLGCNKINICVGLLVH